MLNKFISALAGGLMIALGGCVFMNAYLATQGVYIGAIFFAVAMLCAALKGYAVFTDRAGLLVEDPEADGPAGLLAILGGNAVAALFVGVLLYRAFPKSLGLVAATLMDVKLETTLYGTLLRSLLCGVLMYLAASIYREKGTVLGILFCGPAFILAGFEHSILDIFYFAASGFEGGAKVLGILALTVIGNLLGALLLPLLSLVGEDSPYAEEDEEDVEDGEEEADEAEFEVAIEITDDAAEAAEGDAE